MAKKYGLCPLIVLLAVHGTAMSMMHSKKLYGNTIKLSRLNSDSAKKIDSLERIAQSLEKIERRLEKQNKILALNIVTSVDHSISSQEASLLQEEIYGDNRE